MLCSAIKHARKRGHSRNREKHSPAARVQPTLLSCCHHFLACFITEQSTVLAFLFVNSNSDFNMLMKLFADALLYVIICTFSKNNKEY